MSDYMISSAARRAAQSVLDQAKALGAKVSVVDGRLRFDAPAGVMTPGLRSRLAEHKAEILAMLSGVPATAKSSAVYSAGVWYLPGNWPVRTILEQDKDPHFVVMDLYEAFGDDAITPYIREKVDAVSHVANVESNGVVKPLAVIAEQPAYKLFMKAQSDLAEPFCAKMAMVAKALREQGFYVDPDAVSANGAHPTADPIALLDQIEKQNALLRLSFQKQAEIKAELDAVASSTRKQIEAVATVAAEAKQIACDGGDKLPFVVFLARKGYTEAPAHIAERVKREGGALAVALNRGGRQGLLTALLADEGRHWAPLLRNSGRGHLVSKEKRNPGAWNKFSSNAYEVEWLERQWWPQFARKMGWPL